MTKQQFEDLQEMITKAGTLAMHVQANLLGLQEVMLDLLCVEEGDSAEEIAEKKTRISELIALAQAKHLERIALDLGDTNPRLGEMFLPKSEPPSQEE